MLNPESPGPGYALRWPRALFLNELADIVALDQAAPQPGRVLYAALGRLLREAFAGQAPMDDLGEVWRLRREGQLIAWVESTPSPAEPILQYAALLRRAGARLPQVERRPYWLRRHGINAQANRSSRSERDQQLDLQNGWLAIINDLADAGYLDQAARPDSWDPMSRDRRLARLIAEEAGIAPHHWRPQGTLYEDPEDDDLFYTLVEAVHQFVARPQTTTHDIETGEQRFKDFSRPTGQAVYRWRVNTLLADQDSDLEFAETGEDQGLLVHSTADGRQELLDQAPRHDLDGNQDRIGHAIALFRRRGGTVEDKRSACAALSNVLEDRRKTVLKQQLVKDDEGPLFQIANNFAIRHHRDDQMYGYDEAFLDWIFWWYLATVELTNRLMAREENTGG